MPLNLTAYSDLDVLRVIGEENPAFVDLLADLIDRGMTDTEIIRMAAAANGSGQAMHYVAKCTRALRHIARSKALDELAAESQRLGFY